MIISTIFFHSIIMVRFVENEIAKEKFYASKKPIEIWYVNVGNIVIEIDRNQNWLKQKLILSIWLKKNLIKL